MNKIFWGICFSLISYTTYAQVSCNSSQDKIKISVFTDSFPNEISYALVNKFGTTRTRVFPYTYNSRFRLYVKELCVPKNECQIFSVDDLSNDGIDAPGYIKIEVSGVLVDSIPGLSPGQPYTQIVRNVNCVGAQTCDHAISITEGNHVAKLPHYWYSFVPDSTGYYNISTCSQDNSCDTKLWISNKCEVDPDTNRIGALYYSDNSLECGLKANITKAILTAGKTYYVHVFARATNCPDTTLPWSIYFAGRIHGCRDSSACNFNPLAQVDSVCYYPGDPNCKLPDLLFREDVLKSSVILDTIVNNDPCLINEGCLTGYGVRDIIRFSTRIDNIGNADYFIGDPNNNPEQFSFDNCHRHFHYTLYAEYLLFDSQGRRLPTAFKNGFCVLDLICPNQNMEQYGCEYMGITAGCGDEYERSLDCQWVDITNLPDGDYTFATKVNWEDRIDAAGRKESSKINNWGQFCFNINRSSGRLRMNQLTDCPLYKDCTGEVFGSAVYDCTGNCNGSVLMGDLNHDGQKTMQDALEYVQAIISEDITATACNDLNANGSISVFDADLLANCINFGIRHNHVGSAPHNHCVFPFGTENARDTAYLKISQVNPAAKTVTIALRSPKQNVSALQFKVSGIKIDSIVNLQKNNGYDANISFNPFSSEIISMSPKDSNIKKSNSTLDIFRIHYSDVVGNLVCIDKITDIVSGSHERIRNKIDGTCFTITSTNEVVPFINVRVYPNPATSYVKFSVNLPHGNSFHLELYDVQGNKVFSKRNIETSEYELDKSDLVPGMYIYKIFNSTEKTQGKLFIH